MTSPYYCPSGRIPRLAIPVITCFAFATFPAAWLYAWVSVHVPAIIKIAVMVFYAVLLGVMASQAAASAKIRHPGWMARFGAMIGFVGWYFQWAAWLALTINMHAARPGNSPVGATFLDMITHPVPMVGTMVDVAQVGTWGLGKDPVTGFLLAAFWLVELVLFVTLPATLGHARTKDPFDETSHARAEKIDVPRQFAFIDEPQAVPGFLERHPRELLSVLAPWSESVSPSYATVTIHRCRGEDSYVSIANVNVKIVKEKIEKSPTGVVAFLRLAGIDPDELIRELNEATPESTKPAAKQDTAPISDELTMALDHLNAGRHEAVLAAATPYIASEQFALRTDASRLCALASSSLERWDAACVFWEALFKDEPSAHNALQLATSSVMGGDLVRGESWLARAVAINDAAPEMPRIAMETNFMSALTKSGNMHAAMPYLERIKSVYVALAVTDPTFLFVRHVPRFDVFLDQSMPIVDASMESAQKLDWYASMLPHLDERGKSELNEWMAVQLQPG